MSSRSIKTAQRVFDIIEVLHEDGECNLSHIADEVGLAESTTHQYLATLVEIGVVIKQENTYSLGLKFLEYGGLVRQRLDFYRAAKPELVKLKERTELKGHLAVEEQLDLVRLENIRPEPDFWFGGYVGHRGAFHSSALGKAILAYSPEEKIDLIVEKHGLPALTENTITNRDELDTELETVREHGYAVNDEEDQKNLKAVAYPIRVNESVKGAICVAGPKTDMESNYDLINEHLQAASDRIELRLREQQQPTNSKVGLEGSR